jgi:hypothetical protein
MSEKKRPPLPSDDDEARFDDEAAAIGHPEPLETTDSGSGRAALQLPAKRVESGAKQP